MNFSKTINIALALQAHSMFLVFQKFTGFYLPQTALKIICLPIKDTKAINTDIISLFLPHHFHHLLIQLLLTFH